MIYPYAIHKDPDSDYDVSFPDLLGCVTAGETIEEARIMAQEAAEAHLEVFVDDGDPLPRPSRIDDYVNHPDFEGALFWGVVSIDISKLSNKTKRINITVPERELAAIDAYAKALGLKRSSFLVSAALEKVYASS